MRHPVIAAGLIACAALAAPPANAAPVAHAAPVLDMALGSLPDVETAYAKKGGKGWKTGKKMKRGGPPPWAPAWGRRYRR